MVTLEDAMITDLKKISSEASITQAAKRMRAERVGALAIERVGTLLKDREPQIVGLITEADIVRKAVADEVDLVKSTVEQFMTSPMFTIEATWPLTEAYDMMREGGVRHLLVTQDKKNIGIVSIRDLLVRLQR